MGLMCPPSPLRAAYEEVKGAADVDMFVDVTKKLAEAR
jgi:hypothetical protein